MRYYAHVGRAIIEHNQAYCQNDPPVVVSLHDDNGVLIKQWRVHDIAITRAVLTTWDGKTVREGPAVGVWLELETPFTMIRTTPRGTEVAYVFADASIETIFRLQPGLPGGPYTNSPVAGG